jgi:hypothetical protein
MNNLFMVGLILSYFAVAFIFYYIGIYDYLAIKEYYQSNCFFGIKINTTGN